MISPIIRYGSADVVRPVGRYDSSTVTYQKGGQEYIRTFKGENAYIEACEFAKTVARGQESWLTQ